MNWQSDDITTYSEHLPGATLPWLKKLRAQQWQKLLTTGLPTRHDEAWKYTDVAALSQQNLAATVPLLMNEPAHPTPRETSLAEGESPVIEVTFINGNLTVLAKDLPVGLVVTDLRTALSTHAEWVQRGFAAYQNSNTGLVNFNASLWQNGLFILVADEVIFDKPLIVRYQTVAATAITLVLRNMIFMGKNSQLTVFEEFSSNSSAPYWQQVMTQVDLAEHAQLHHSKCQNEGEFATHLSENFIQQAANSQLTSCHFALGAQLQRQAWLVSLAGRDAHCECQGLNILNKNQHSDYHVTMDHQAHACVSEQVFKAIASDKSRGVFNGKVIVQPAGQQAVAQQLSQNLVLSSLAEIDTRPELEIYADDVKCTHGASVGQLDPDALFYLRSRGISRSESSELLLRAFVHQQLEALPSAIQGLIEPLLNAKLAELNRGQCS